MPKHRTDILTGKQVMAARLRGMGYSTAKTCSEIRISQSTLHKWERMPLYIEKRDLYCRDQMGALVAEAYGVLREDMQYDDGTTNGRYLRQQAAGRVISIAQASEQRGNTVINVSFGDELEIGMPEAAPIPAVIGEAVEAEYEVSE